MALKSQPAQVLDHRFFRNTGFVLVMGTLMAGAITLTLMINITDSAATIIAGNLNRDVGKTIGMDVPSLIELGQDKIHMQAGN